VITGGTDGMGRALARTYLERGDSVAVVGRDLLGVAFAARHGGHTRYVLIHPGGVSTSVACEYDEATAEPLSAFVRHRPIGRDLPSFGRRAAERLHELTLRLTGSQAVERR
jgi:NAD(P)-dependent dehydrogenase (short-subunit alcohol dehydrogenase family)